MSTLDLPFYMLDLSQVFEVDDILWVPQTIKGFDKPDFYEVFLIYVASLIMLWNFKPLIYLIQLFLLN